jgi:anti-anti-sigma regulatory factor
VVDLSGVRALTAADLGRLVALHNRLKASGGRLVLSNVGPLAAEVLRLTRLTDLFEVRPAA